MFESYIPPYELSKREKNDLFRLIEQSLFPIVDFDLVRTHIKGHVEPPAAHLFSEPKFEPVSELVTVICHRTTQSYFGIIKRMSTYQAIAYVAQRISIEKLSEDFKYLSSAEGEWDVIPPAFLVWLDRIRKYIEFAGEPDLWSELARFRELLTATDLKNTPFSRDEQAAISVRIQRAKEYVQTSDGLTRAQISRIEARLDHAEEASKRIGRKDWLMMVTGSILGLVLTDTITPQVADHIIMLIVHGFGHFLGQGSPPPQLP